MPAASSEQQGGKSAKDQQSAGWLRSDVKGQRVLRAGLQPLQGMLAGQRESECPSAGFAEGEVVVTMRRRREQCPICGADAAIGRGHPKKPSTKPVRLIHGKLTESAGRIHRDELVTEVADPFRADESSGVQAKKRQQRMISLRQYPERRPERDARACGQGRLGDRLRCRAPQLDDELIGEVFGRERQRGTIHACSGIHMDDEAEPFRFRVGGSEVGMTALEGGGGMSRACGDECRQRNAGHDAGERLQN